MTRSAFHRTGHSLVVIAAAALLAACADEGALGPDRQAETTRFTADPGAAYVATAVAGIEDGSVPQLTNAGVCENLNVEPGNKLAFRTYASGVQIYRWNGTTWVFVAPDALLFADAAGNGLVGTHYAGPTWEAMGGSKVVGAVVDRCKPDPAAIDWLLLAAVSSQGPGIFHRVTFIQRLNTAGGTAPSQPGTHIGEEARVPYTTEYFFYQAQ